MNVFPQKFPHRTVRRQRWKAPPLSVNLPTPCRALTPPPHPLTHIHTHSTLIMTPPRPFQPAPTSDDTSASRQYVLQQRFLVRLSEKEYSALSYMSVLSQKRPLLTCWLRGVFRSVVHRVLVTMTQTRNLRSSGMLRGLNRSLYCWRFGKKSRSHLQRFKQPNKTL